MVEPSLNFGAGWNFSSLFYIRIFSDLIWESKKPVYIRRTWNGFEIRQHLHNIVSRKHETAICNKTLSLTGVCADLPKWCILARKRIRVFIEA